MTVRHLTLSLGLLLSGSAWLFAAPIDELNTPLDNRGNDAPTLPSGAKESTKPSLGFLEESGTQIPELTAASEAFRSGKIEDAEALFAKAEEAHPNLPPAKLMLARLYLSAGEKQKGRQLMEQVAATHPRHPEVYLLFANLALSEGRLADAMLHFQASVGFKSPKSWPHEQVEKLVQTSLLGQITVWERRGNWEKATQLIEKLIEIRPNDATLRDRYGADLFLAGKEREAYEQFGISFRLNGQMNRPEISMGVMFIRQGDLTQANRWFNRTIEKYPNEPRVHFEFSSALLMQDRAEKAKVHGEKAAELGMTGPGLWMQRGLTARQLEEHDEAAGFFEQFLALSPSNFEAMNQLTLALVEQDDPEKQRRAAQLAVLNARQYPRSSQALSTLGWVNFRLGKTKDAEKWLRQAASLPGASAETLFYLAQVLEHSGNSTPATDQRLRETLQAAVDQPGLFVLRPQVRQWLKSHSEG